VSQGRALRRVEGAKTGRRRARRDRVPDLPARGPRTRPRTHQPGRHQDVAEDDRPSTRTAPGLAGTHRPRGPAARTQVEEAHLRPDSLVPGEVPPALAHQPDGRRATLSPRRGGTRGDPPSEAFVGAYFRHGLASLRGTSHARQLFSAPGGGTGHVAVTRVRDRRHSVTFRCLGTPRGARLRCAGYSFAPEAP